MKSLRLICKYSIIITLPVSLFFIIWAYQTIQLYIPLAFHFGPDTTKDYLKISGDISFYNILDFILNTARLKKVNTDINLYIKEANIQGLNANLPYSGFEYRKGYIIYPDGDLHKVKVRYRGDSVHHWLFNQKSYKIKTPKKRLFNKARIHNLILPKGCELLNNHISYILAKRLGLLAPESQMVSLSINNRSRGIRLMASNINELFLRKHSRMPNDIYKGDNIFMDEKTGVPGFLFAAPYLWRKAAYNNHYPRENRKPIFHLFHQLENEDYSLIDLEDFARFSVLISLSNCLHYDNRHNWVLYYDNYKERFFTITWDTMGWWPLWADDFEKTKIIDFITASIFEKLYRNYVFLYYRQQAFHDFFKYHKIDFIHDLDAEIVKLKAKLHVGNFYRNRVENNLEIRNRSETIQAIDDFRERVIRSIDQAKKLTMDTPGLYAFEQFENKVRLSIDGRMGVRKIIFKFKNNIDNLPKLKIAYLLNKNLIQKDVSHLTWVAGNELIMDVPLFAKVVIPSPERCYTQRLPVVKVNFSQATFDIVFNNRIQQEVESVSLQLMDLTDSIVKVTRTQSIKPVALKDAVDVIRDDPGKGLPEVWEGTKEVVGSLTIYKNLIIKPGTIVRLAPDALVKVFGRVTAEGTSTNPIRFTGLDPERPWGAFVIKDNAAGGSSFNYCFFDNGSGSKGDLFDYTAMFSVHHVKDVSVRNSVFENSRRTDDMIHIVYSEAVFENTVFKNARSDALDADISELTLKNCRFMDSGNDAVDLMTSKAAVVNSHISNAGDKGISVGEHSMLLSINTTFSKNKIAVQSKDDSSAVIYNALFEENETVADAYKKNWQYGGGGSIEILKSVIADNIHNISVDKKSRARIVDSYITGRQKRAKRVEWVLCDGRSKTIPANKTKSELKTPVTGFFDNFLKEFSRDDIRGVPNGK